MPGPETFCDDIEPLLSDYADGEIASDAEKSRIERHLQTCSRCTSDLAFFRATNFVIARSMPDVQPPVDLFVRTAQATYARPTLRQRIARWLEPTPVRVGLGSALAAAVVIAVVVPIAESPRGNSPAQPIAEVNPAIHAIPQASKGTVGSVAHNSAPATTLPKSVAGHSVAVVAPVQVASNAAARNRDISTAKSAAKATPASAVSRTTIASTGSQRSVTVPLHPHGFPILADRINHIALIPSVMHEPKLASRSGWSRTLPNGEAHHEFVAPAAATSPVESAVPARPTPPDVSITMPPISVASTQGTSAAEKVAMVTPRDFHISLGGAGNDRTGTMTTIQAKIDHDTYDAQNGILPLVKTEIH